jgi:UDP-N-acetylmuramyl pentapeptide synthase
MKFSWWTQYWRHSGTFSSSRKEVLERLLKYYQSSSKSFRLISRDENSLRFARGHKWVSIIGLGSEKWAYHVIDVKATDLDNQVRVEWDIDLKVFGFQFASNAIVEECKMLLSRNA